MKFAVAVTGLLAVAVACSTQDGTTGVTSSALIPPTADGGSSTRPTTTTGPSTTSYTQGAFQVAPGGNSGSVVAAGDASPWIVASDGYMYHYNNDCAPPRSWVQELFSAGTTSLAVSPEGTPWRVDSNGYVYKRNGANTCTTANNSWTAMQAGFSAWEIGVGRTNAAWAIGRNGCVAGDCPIYQWSSASAAWQQVSGAARHVAVAPDGTAYVSNNSGTLYKWNGTSWVSWGSGCVRNFSNGDHLGWPVIAAAPNDNVWVLGCSGTGSDNYVYAWLPQTASWQQIPNAAGTSISVSADGTPWLINSAHSVYEYVSTGRSSHRDALDRRGLRSGFCVMSTTFAST